jgi:hypothetical protein
LVLRLKGVGRLHGDDRSPRDVQLTAKRRVGREVKVQGIERRHHQRDGQDDRANDLEWPEVRPVDRSDPVASAL